MEALCRAMPSAPLAVAALGDLLPVDTGQGEQDTAAGVRSAALTLGPCSLTLQWFRSLPATANGTSGEGKPSGGPRDPSSG